MTSREEVYKIIDSEREYQDKKWDGVNQDGDSRRSVADWVLFVEKHLTTAKEFLYRLNEEEALDEIRKIAALCVACMEHNETSPRE